MAFLLFVDIEHYLDSKFRNKIIQSTRKLTFQWGPRNECKKNAKVAPASFECASCGLVVYEGKSSKKLETLSEQFERVIMGTIYVDHINPTVCPKEGFIDWNTYFDRMFCPVENLQCLCKTCHDEKSKEEREIRKKYKKKDK